MALPTYLELVNDVLVRLREPEVSTVQENVLSKLIGKLVNDAKRQVEDAYTWSALTTSKTISAVASTYTYSVVGTGSRFKVVDGYNITKNSALTPTSSMWMNYQFYSTPSPQTGEPTHFLFKGVDSNGDAKVDIFPIPEASYTLLWNMYVPQVAMVHDTDALMVPSEPVILGAFARALVERGEDGGLNSSEAYGLYKASLADAIAIESGRYAEEDAWEAV